MLYWYNTFTACPSGDMVTFLKFLMSSKVDELSLVTSKCQHIYGHPVSDFLNASLSREYSLLELTALWQAQIWNWGKSASHLHRDGEEHVWHIFDQVNKYRE